MQEEQHRLSNLSSVMFRDFEEVYILGATQSAALTTKAVPSE